MLPNETSELTPTPGPECLTPTKLLAFYDSELPATEAAVARQHLEKCPYCRAETAMWHEMERFCDVVAGPGECIPPDLPGYHCIRLLGRGGFGTVWLAEDEEMHRPRAVKILHPGVLSEDNLQNLRDEAALIDDLGAHPHRVRVYRVLTTCDGPVLVMEYVPGSSLAALAAEFAPDAAPTAPPAWDRLCRYLAQVADALVDVHARGIRHGDVTPQNVLINRAKDFAVLVDFGLATRSFDRRGGTVGFAAPEVVRSVGEPASDVYGLAATAWWLLTGSPRNPDNAFLPPTAPRELEKLLQEALDPNPTRRPTAGQFRDRARQVPAIWLGSKLQAIVTRLTLPVRLDVVGSLLDSHTRTTRVSEIAIAGKEVGAAEFIPVAHLEGFTGDHLAIRATASRDGFFTLLNLTSKGELEAQPLPNATPELTRAGKTAEIVGPLEPPAGTEFVAVVWTPTPASATTDWRAKILAVWSELHASNDPDRTFVPLHVSTSTALNDWAAALFVVRHSESI